MNKDARANFRIEESLKDAFYEVAKKRGLSVSAMMIEFMETYVDGSLEDDPKDFLKLYSEVQSLHDYSSTMNKIARKLNSSDVLDPRFTPEYVELFIKQTRAVTRAYKDVVTPKSEVLAARINSLSERLGQKDSAKKST